MSVPVSAVTASEQKLAAKQLPRAVAGPARGVR